MTFLTKQQLTVGEGSLWATADPQGAAPPWFLLPEAAGGRAGLEQSLPWRLAS